jgi:TRAP-type C4-dicarboxylate transport system permease small subunit
MFTAPSRAAGRETIKAAPQRGPAAGRGNMKALRTVLDYIDKCCHWFIIIGLTIMTLVLFAQVAARYFFNSGLSWSEELSRYIMIWVVYLGAAVVYKDNSHISVTALEETLGAQARLYLNLFQKAVSMVFIGLVGWYSSLTLEFAAMQTSPNMLIPMNYVYMVFPISSVLIILHLIISIIDDLSGKNPIPSAEDKDAWEIGLDHVGKPS